MKNLFLTFLCFGLILTSCDDNDDNLDFVTVASTFEEVVDFTSADGFIASEFIDIPNNINVTNGEVPLVFLLDPSTTGPNGEDVFEPITRTFFFDDGGFAEYRFNFSVASLNDGGGVIDIELVLESDDFDALGPAFTDNQIFRIVIVPSFFAEANPDISFEELQSQFDLEIENLKN